MPEPHVFVSLAEALPQEQARVREVLAIYKSLGAAGVIGAAMIEDDLRAADRAIATQDIVAMLRCYQTLKQIHE
ncbi:hypothetical protein [Geothrix campi]|uniref:hypothetical protein n=1 Tax=Geothrix campi TaxID=2966450 RepID=UPI0021497068|nr:hypothetical protein [Geothrix sp. SG10]